MTDKALAERLRQQASVARLFDEGPSQRAADLDRAADLIERMSRRHVEYDCPQCGWTVDRQEDAA